ncbi:MAG: WGxxGxxG-CTERM domain-containing protein [Parachlamydiaceae bacterium]|nr:WGxxGxxG-CTERM domain-containing protein [Parachlamydiaceae bacterium]
MLSAGTANAEPNSNIRTPTTTTDRDFNTARTTTERDHDTDWGWIGLLGLLGLGGLMPKKRTIDNDRVEPGNRTINR